MPYFQPNANNAFGFQPVEQGTAMAKTGQYMVSSSFGSPVFKGDLMIITTSAGFVVPSTAVGVAGAAGIQGGNVVGVSAQFLPTVTSGSTGWITARAPFTYNLLVYDHPDQVFVVQDNGSTAITSVAVGLNIDVTSTLAGSTSRRGISRMQLATST